MIGQIVCTIVLYATCTLIGVLALALKSEDKSEIIIDNMKGIRDLLKRVS